MTSGKAKEVNESADVVRLNERRPLPDRPTPGRIRSMVPRGFAVVMRLRVPEGVNPDPRTVGAFFHRLPELSRGGTRNNDFIGRWHIGRRVPRPPRFEFSSSS